jgi:hypothetical protein
MNLVSKAVFFALSLLLSAWPTLPQENTCGKRLLPIFVTEKDGSMVTTLNYTDFKLQASSGSMSVIALNHDERRHRVIIMLDVSASMRGLVGAPLWPIAVALARNASYAGGENSDLALLLFSDHVLETIGFSQGRTAIQKRLGELAKDPAFPMPKKANDSRVYDVLEKEVRDLKSPTSADSLLVITDGGDEGSKTKPDQVINSLSSSMIRVFTILVDPIQGQSSTVGPEAFARIVKTSGGKVFGPIDSNNAAFQKTAKTAEAQKVLEERLRQFYSGIFANDLLVVETPSAIQKPETVELTLTDSGRQKVKRVQLHFPHEFAPCSEIASSGQKVE